MAEGAGGLRLTACDARAKSLGLVPGESLADARAKAGPLLQVRPADPAGDRAALVRLCLWATRYAPAVAPYGPPEGEDGLFLDVSGAAHLHGGEAGLLADLRRRLDGFGLAARLALAEGPGPAWALARHGPDGLILGPGAEAAALAPLPVAALRLDPATRLQLRRLGLRRIGALAAADPAPLARRFGRDLVRRLEQAQCRRPEPLAPVRPVPVHAAARSFLEPVTRQETVLAVAEGLMRALAPGLVAAATGARRLALVLHRVDGVAFTLDFALAAPTREAAHLGRLLRLRLDRPDSRIEAGFGFETIRLEVLRTGPIAGGQGGFAAREAPAAGAERLADALHQRLGRRLARLVAVESHRPERAVRLRPSEAPVPCPSSWSTRAGAPRPLLRLPVPEPVRDVLALVPDGPPLRFRWRTRLHRVIHAQGPERIAPEWWRDPGGRTRDYYVVEDEAGRRLWVYREGLYGSSPDGGGSPTRVSSADRETPPVGKPSPAGETTSVGETSPVRVSPPAGGTSPAGEATLSGQVSPTGEVPAGEAWFVHGLFA